MSGFFIPDCIHLVCGVLNSSFNLILQEMTFHTFNSKILKTRIGCERFYTETQSVSTYLCFYDYRIPHVLG